jgi:hypothetical protein
MDKELGIFQDSLVLTTSLQVGVTCLLLRGGMRGNEPMVTELEHAKLGLIPQKVWFATQHSGLDTVAQGLGDPTDLGQPSGAISRRGRGTAGNGILLGSEQLMRNIQLFPSGR